MKWFEKATIAQRSVNKLFLKRYNKKSLLASSFDHGRKNRWDYWWQAHYIGLLIDAGERTGSAYFYNQANALARGVYHRNKHTWVNNYYDDMAWMSLSLNRLLKYRDTDFLRKAQNALEKQLHKAWDEKDSGMYWRKRDEDTNEPDYFKNVPANAPSALFFLRTGQTKHANQIIDWVNETLFDGKTGLYMDGIYPDGKIVRDLYTYNQGTMLAALLESGRSENFDRANDLVEAIYHHFFTNGSLETHGGNDGTLFTGILARYLTLAYVHPKVSEDNKKKIVQMVADTAELFWQSRSRRVGVRYFSTDPHIKASEVFGKTKPINLTSQLQCWTFFEAAAFLYRLQLD